MAKKRTERNAKVNENLLDNAPDYLAPIVNLIRWSASEDFSSGTAYLLFLDLTGYSRENFGDTINNPSYRLQYFEAEYLADALKIWATNPESVFDFIYQHEITAE